MYLQQYMSSVEEFYLNFKFYILLIIIFFPFASKTFIPD